MFNGPDYPKALDEDLFDAWLEKGRSRKMGYNYLLIIWNALEIKYSPIYIEDRNELHRYEVYGESSGIESLVAVYDLYSESRIILQPI